MNWICNRCPNKAFILILRALGKEIEAQEIIDQGCPWRWNIKVEDTNTGQEKTIDICGAEALPQFLNSYGSRNVEVAQSIQSLRNEYVNGIEQLINLGKKRMVYDKLLLDHFTKQLDAANIKVIKELNEVEGLLENGVIDGQENNR